MLPAALVPVVDGDVVVVVSVELGGVVGVVLAVVLGGGVAGVVDVVVVSDCRWQAPASKEAAIIAARVMRVMGVLL